MEENTMNKLKKMILLLLAAMLPLVAMLVMAACNDGMPENGRTLGHTDRADKSKKTVIDTGKYFDMTVTANNAKKYSKEDLMYEANGTFRIEGGNSYITINRQDGTIILSSDNAFYKGIGGRNMYAKYVFDVSAANSDCLYIRMGSKNKAQFIIDGKGYANEEVPDLAVCLPLYGFGRNRLELSSIMNGFIAMPSGTYWRTK
jgi:hypothetical protein